MAKKLRKVRSSPRLLLAEFLLPWVVMGFVALVGVQLELDDIAITTVALACALAVTVMIWYWEQKRRRVRNPGSNP